MWSPFLWWLSCKLPRRSPCDHHAAACFLIYLWIPSSAKCMKRGISLYIVSIKATYFKSLSITVWSVIKYELKICDMCFNIQTSISGEQWDSLSGKHREYTTLSSWMTQFLLYPIYWPVLPFWCKTLPNPEMPFQSFRFHTLVCMTPQIKQQSLKRFLRSL